MAVAAPARLNLDGDGQGDLTGHGGEQRAVFVYQMVPQVTRITTPSVHPINLQRSIMGS
jgi:MOSC domain-containing protein YiiM